MTILVDDKVLFGSSHLLESIINSGHSLLVAGPLQSCGTLSIVVNLVKSSANVIFQGETNSPNQSPIIRFLCY